MQTINIKRDKLIDIIKENRKKHIADFEKAKLDYKNVFKNKLTECWNQFNSTGECDLYKVISITKPSSYEKEYDSTILMLELEESPVIPLCKQDFNNFVEDNWSWKNHFVSAASGLAISNLEYTSGL